MNHPFGILFVFYLVLLFLNWTSGSIWDTRISRLPNRADSWLLLAKLKHKQIGNIFFQQNKPITVLDRNLPSQKNLLEGSYRFSTNRDLYYTYKERNYLVRLGKTEAQKKETNYSKEYNKQPFRTPNSYRSNRSWSRTKNIEIRNSIFWGESRTWEDRKKKKYLLIWPQSSKQLLWKGMIKYWKDVKHMVKILRFRLPH